MNKPKTAPKDNFKHSFTWLKMLLGAYLIELLLINFFIHDLSQTFIEAWLPVLLLATAGLVIGFLINAFFNFYKPVIFYATGHFIVLLAIVLYFRYGFSHTDSQPTRHMNAVTHGAGQSDQRQVNQVIAAFDREYPEESCDISVIDLFPPDSCDLSIRTCYIVFENFNEGKQFFNQYRISSDSVKTVFHNVPVPSPIYEDYLQKSKARKMLRQLADSVRHIRPGS